jgi:hypothetical protein
MDSNRLKEIEELLMAADLYFSIKISESYKMITDFHTFENINNSIETIH